MRDEIFLQQLDQIVEKVTEDNLGDYLLISIKVLEKLQNPISRRIAEKPMSYLRHKAAGADIGWNLFETPIKSVEKLNTIEHIQIVALASALHELCYGFENIEIAANKGWGGSPATRFYLNSIYHYLSSMFLIDESRPSHERFEMGGTVVKVLHPLGIDNILERIKNVLEKPFGNSFSFGESILKLRHSYLVHGDFSPKRTEYLVTETEMRNPVQQEKFSALLWELFYEVILLRLQVLAYFTNLNVNHEEIIHDYMLEISQGRKK